MINVIVYGAAGRMGSTICRMVLGSKDLCLVAAVERPDHPAVGEVVSFSSEPVILSCRGGPDRTELVAGPTTAILKEADVVADFSNPESTVNLAERCAEHKIPVVTGTTGLHPIDQAMVRIRSQEIAIVQSPNFSVTTNLLFKIVEETAGILGDGYDAEIIEVHHRHKKDAPSGTARRLAEVVARGLNRNLAKVAVYGREGTVGERTNEEIGIHAVRAGDIVGEHTVMFATQGERLELTHRASSREAFARGALLAARWVIGKPPGLYDMFDVLGLKRS